MYTGKRLSGNMTFMDTSEGIKTDHPDMETILDNIL